MSEYQTQPGCVLMAEEAAEGLGFLQLIPLSDPHAGEGSSALLGSHRKTDVSVEAQHAAGWFLSAHLY